MKDSKDDVDSFMAELSKPESKPQAKVDTAAGFIRLDEFLKKKQLRNLNTRRALAIRRYQLQRDKFASK